VSCYQEIKKGRLIKKYVFKKDNKKMKTGKIEIRKNDYRKIDKKIFEVQNDNSK
jgi:hypothetical protein